VPRLLEADGPSASLRSLAEAARVTVPTLVHYFGDRSGAVVAAVHEMRAMGAVHVERAATEPHGLPEESLRWFLKATVQAWRMFGVGRILSMMMAAGMHDPAVGPAYIDDILEPLLQAAERRIADHIARGEMPPCDPRVAGLELVAPIVLALLHQDPLGGSRCRPLDVDALLEEHVRRFGKAFLGPSNG
jgi:AcrR family transcriptional regulator